MRPIVVFAVTAGGVLSMYAPPAITFRQEPHFQMPVAWRLTLSFPQKTQLYFECCDTSIFLMFFLMEAPYRMPYLPQMPTFFVRLPILATCVHGRCVFVFAGGVFVSCVVGLPSSDAGCRRGRSRAADGPSRALPRRRRPVAGVAALPTAADGQTSAVAARGSAAGLDARQGCPVPRAGAGGRRRRPQGLSSGEFAFCLARAVGGSYRNALELKGS